VQYLAHSASFHSDDEIAPSKHGAKHLSGTAAALGAMRLLVLTLSLVALAVAGAMSAALMRAAVRPLGEASALTARRICPRWRRNGCWKFASWAAGRRRFKAARMCAWPPAGRWRTRPPPRWR
jgi:hypothetical protein